MFRKTRRFVGILICLAIFMPIFSAYKSSIPIFNPYAWDETFIVLDRLIFFGFDAWEIMHPLFGYPLVTSIISASYHLWYMLIYIGSIAVGIFIQNDMLRQRYFICYFLIWSIIGIFFANILSSVGPAFVGPLLGMQEFDAQMTYLQSANEHWPIGVLDIQHILLEWHRSGDHGYGRGISAMPSMHVALAFMFFLAMRHVSVLLSRLALAFTILIFIGSVHLAYHYAVDGLLAILLVMPLWIVAGRLASLPENRGLEWLAVPLRELASSARKEKG